MYTNVHGSSGAMIFSACPNKFIGAILAFLSHYLLDYLGETGYGKKNLVFMIEGTFLFLFLLMAFYSTDASGYFIGWMLGNGPDLIDKRLLLNMNAKQYLSCHGFPGWKFGNFKIGIFSFSNWKLGYPSKIKLNKKQTITTGIVSTVFLLVFTIMKSNGFF